MTVVLYWPPGMYEQFTGTKEPTVSAESAVDRDAPIYSDQDEPGGSVSDAITHLDSVLGEHAGLISDIEVRLQTVLKTESDTLAATAVLETSADPRSEVVRRIASSTERVIGLSSRLRFLLQRLDV